MRELGYQGPFVYADKIKGCGAMILINKPQPDHPGRGPRTAIVGEVKPNVLRKYVQHFRKQMNLPQAQGRFICWVGLRANQIGEDSVLDQLGYPEYARKLRDMLAVGGMGGMGNGGCNPQ